MAPVVKEAYRKIQRTSVPDQIFEQLRESIAAGAREPGDSLPSEAQLAEEFGASRMSVRTALNKLETLGLVEVRPGEGTFVIEFRPATFMKGLSPLMSKAISAIEMIEFRKALEIECLKLAFKRASAEEIGALESIYRDYYRALRALDYENLVSHDYKFHYQIFLMSRNNLFKEIYESMREHFFLNMEESEKIYTAEYGFSTEDTDAHALVLKAFKAGDLQAAIAAFTAMFEELITAYGKITGTDPDTTSDKGEGKR